MTPTLAIRHNRATVQELLHRESEQRIAKDANLMPWEARSSRVEQIRENIARQHERASAARVDRAALTPLLEQFNAAVEEERVTRERLTHAQLTRAKDLLGPTQAWHDAQARVSASEKALRPAELLIYQSCWAPHDIVCYRAFLGALDTHIRSQLTPYISSRERQSIVAALNVLGQTAQHLSQMTGGDAPPVDDVAQWLADATIKMDEARQAVLDAPEPEEPDWVG